MIRSLWIAKTGMEAQQVALDAISHNLANTATNGYKRGHAVFEDLMYQNLRQTGANNAEQAALPTGLQVGLGVRPVAMARNFAQGNLQQTGGNLDMAVRGNGFFQIQMPDGTTGYSRDGAFQLNSQGQIVTNGGYLVQPGITIPGGLDPKGENLFAESASSGAPAAGAPGANGLGHLTQGAVETSNVNVVEELVSMIQTQRAYEINSKAVKTSDEMLQKLGQL